MNDRERFVRGLFESAGIAVNGPRPTDLRVKNPLFYRRFFADGRLALCESYMDGWWDCDDLYGMFCKFYDALGLIANNLRSPAALWIRLRETLLPFGSLRRSRHIGRHHYDIGNELYRRMLDGSMSYSCGLWREGARDLAEAQQHKLRRICDKLQLEPGHHILEIGCGWGSFAHYATTHFPGTRVTGLTVSAEQIRLGRERCHGLPVELLYQDYREHRGRYPRVVSIAMFEAVGRRYFRDYFKKVADSLDDDGIFFLHTIGFNTSNYASPWIQKYIFPGAYLPSMTQLGKASEGLFVMEHLENIGPDYAPTLLAWHRNFARHWDDIRSADPEKYDERFRRLWTFYLLQCAATFTTRLAPVWQIVLRKPSARGTYFFNAPARRSTEETPIPVGRG
jgi:cyclopropane-fatty-acyl-phospholipid synthase